MFLGWYDADRRTPASDKVAAAIERYVEKFGSEPNTILMGSPKFEDVYAAYADRYTVRAVSFIQGNTFYVGVEDDPAPTADPF
jgi:hypothetical protein